MNLLIVDENPAQTARLCGFLAESNHTIVLAKSERQALNMLVDHNFDAVVCGISFSDGNYRPVIAAINVAKRSADLPVYLVAATAPQRVLCKAMAAGHPQVHVMDLDRQTVKLALVRA